MTTGDEVNFRFIKYGRRAIDYNSDTAPIFNVDDDWNAYAERLDQFF